MLIWFDIRDFLPPKEVVVLGYGRWDNGNDGNDPPKEYEYSLYLTFYEGSEKNNSGNGWWEYPDLPEPLIIEKWAFIAFPDGKYKGCYPNSHERNDRIKKSD